MNQVEALSMPREWIAFQNREEPLHHRALPLDLETLLPGGAGWEIELGFGKGTYLLAQAAAHPERRYMGIEVAAKYYRIARDRGRKRGLKNLALLRTDAEYLLAAGLPVGEFSAVHAYFPDPWPKARHQKRRLFGPDSIDLVLRLMQLGGRLYFATDHLEYGEAVRELLETQPGLETRELDAVWTGGPRTNYEVKYVREGRLIVRLVATRRSPTAAHPASQRRGLVVAGWLPEQDEEEMWGEAST